MIEESLLMKSRVHGSEPPAVVVAAAKFVQYGIEPRCKPVQDLSTRGVFVVAGGQERSAEVDRPSKLRFESPTPIPHQDQFPAQTLALP